MAQPFIVSTDCAGITGDVALWKYLWETTLSHPHCKGVEMIGWRWGESLITSARKQDISVYGIHGRTAGWNESTELKKRALLCALNQLFLTQESLVNLAPQVEYVLLHRSCMSTRVTQLLEKHRSKLKTVAIENVLSEGDTQKTIETVHYLRDKKIPACMMFDLVHFLREPYLDGPDMKRFDKLLLQLENFVKETFPVYLHFPIGPYPDDSLPITQFSSSMWRELSHVLRKLKPSLLVLENQQERAYSLSLPKSQWNAVRSRNESVVQKLFEEGIL